MKKSLALLMMTISLLSLSLVACEEEKKAQVDAAAEANSADTEKTGALAEPAEATTIAPEKATGDTNAPSTGTPGTDVAPTGTDAAPAEGGTTPPPAAEEKKVAPSTQPAN